MQLQKIKLSQLIQPKRNVRIHTQKQLQEFEKSIRMFGQIRPIVIDENNMILAGNGMYETLQRMNWETAECYQYMELTENQKKKLMIADNKIFSLGIENLDTLNDFLVELQGDLDIPGFDEDILRQMVSDADEITEKVSEYGTLDEEQIKSIQENNKRRELKEAEPHDTLQRVETTDKTDVETTNTAAHVETEQITDVQRFVTCPKCGEKIWL